MSFGKNCKYKSEEKFKQTVKDKLDIDLGKIEYNPGMRTIAKLCLNSLWRKFGQRLNMNKTKYVTEPKEFYDILLDDKVINLNILFINEGMVMTCNMKDHFVENNSSTNIFIASFTTSHARMMLYDVLDKLGNRVLGYDTDSARYVERLGDENLITTGDSLGDITDELDGEYITDWVGTGPKSYSYKTSDSNVVCKVKGFTLNHENSQLINFDSMKKMVKGEIVRITIVKEQMITRDNKTNDLVNKYQEKDFKLVFDKRRVVKKSRCVETFPWGY